MRSATISACSWQWLTSTRTDSKTGSTGKLLRGDVLKLRVTAVKEDGKLNLTAQKKAYLQMDEDAESVFSVIEEFAGVLPFDDKSFAGGHKEGVWLE